MTRERHVVIEKGPTALYLKCAKSGRFVDDSAISIHPFLKRHLMEYEWDPRRKQSFVTHHYFRYDRKTGTLHLPVNILHHLENYMGGFGVTAQITELKPNDSEVIDIVNLGNFEDRENQIRGIEFLSNDHPMKALELQTGCLAGDTVINFNHASESSTLLLKDAYEQFSSMKQANGWVSPITTFVRSFTGEIIQLHTIDDIIYSGIKSIYRVTLANGRFLRCTSDHKSMTRSGMIEAEAIVGSDVMCDNHDSDKSIPEYSKAISYEYEGEEPAYDICCSAPHHNFIANGIVTSNSGKTYSAVRAIMNVKQRTLVIVPASLVQQWYDAMFSMVDTKVGIIRGGKSIMDIIKLDYDFEYDILLASISTLQEYACGGASYELLPPFREFIRNLKVGFKIVDECHLNFYANVMIDIQSDIRYNAYLSATHMRSKSSNTIFQKVYPPAIRFDGGVDYDRYVNITELQYNIGYIDERWIKTNRGYAQPKYEKLLMRSPQKLDDFLERILYRAVEEYYIAKKGAGQKLLVIVGCREFATIVTAWFNATYEQLRAICFLYETPEEELNDEHVDVIVSTAGSCGTGRDIKNLRSMIVFTSFSSEQLVWQSLGRLRKLPDDTPEFVNLVNTQLPSHIRHAELKRQIYNQAGKRFTIVRS